ncbi:PPOX class F420-dependent oxidoreductase [Pseudokineococcus basanitobsidens]|uniref:PPOX class F420-dependent oxidoreductase n=1 Tax=Pseudokineococcus basanitobsidens TaxID=1926649 RepID=A0ABU8RIV9_9ACTN
MPQIATSTTVSREEMLEFTRPRHRVLLITRRRSDGGPQASPVSCGVDEQGRFVISTYPERAKSANVRASGRASVVVLSDDWDGPWMQVDGDAELLEMPDALEPLVDYFRSISGEHPDWDEYREAMARQGKALVRLTPTRWSPVATGGFPARLG